jgi:hypothetical protein
MPVREIVFTAEKAAALCDAHNHAVKSHLYEFEFEGDQYTTRYAYYLLHHLAHHGLVEKSRIIEASA